MSNSRLTLAFSAGAISVPAMGTICVVRPPAGAALPEDLMDRCIVAHGAAPEVGYWKARGFSVDVALPDTAAATIVFLPRAKALARSLIAQALARSRTVIVDGQKTDGVDSILKELRACVDVTAPYAKAHGKCFSISGPASALADWVLPDQLSTPSGWVTAPGVFSADGPDPASVALGDALPADMKGRVADLGAGWGYLAAQVLKRPGVSACALVEAEHAALEAARANIDDPRAEFHWSDATAWSSDVPFDHVVANPPFHNGRAATPALGAAFIAAAARLLTPRGTLWLVANRHLPYEAALAQSFAETRTLDGPDRYKLIAATRPLARRR